MYVQAAQASLNVGPRVAQPRKEAQRAAKNQAETSHGQTPRKSVKLCTWLISTSRAISTSQFLNFWLVKLIKWAVGKFAPPTSQASHQKKATSRNNLLRLVEGFSATSQVVFYD